MGAMAFRAPPYVALMRRCWADDPVERPSFPEIQELLEAMGGGGEGEGLASSGGSGYQS
jgi:hypothetical protein